MQYKENPNQSIASDTFSNTNKHSVGDDDKISKAITPQHTYKTRFMTHKQ